MANTHGRTSRTSIREIADTVIVSATRFCVCDAPKCVDRRAGLRNAIEKALRNRDKRAVKIIEDHQAQDKCEDNCWTTIKAAIRKED